MHNTDLILTLTAGFAAAMLLGLLALRLKLPPIVGYLLAGLIIGPNTPGFVANRQIAEQLAEIGVILLMFGVGLHFHFKDLLAVRNIALSGATFQIACATALGAVAAHAIGWSWESGLVFGFALSVASTVVLTRVLADNGDLQTHPGKIAIGWLVVEDLVTVFALVLLPAIAGGAQNLPLVLALTTLKLGAFGVVMLWPGARIIPRVLAAAARTGSRELFTLSVLVVALGIAVASAQLFGVSMALGAFLAGMVVGQSEFSYRAASEALPMRDAFAVLFFVSVGMLFNPERLLAAPALTALAIAIVLFGKPLAAFLITMLLGYGARVGIRVSVALAQVGEFSFIVAVLAHQLRILPEAATDAIVGASILTITLNPLLYRAIPAIEPLLPRGRKHLATAPRPAGPSAVIIGYGPVGQAVSELLASRGLTPTIVELNIETVRYLNRQGIAAVYGDAERVDVLEQAGVREATALVLSVPGSPESSEIVRAARRLNPGIYVLARAAFMAHAEMIRKAGADQVFSGETEVANAMTKAIVERLEATVP